MAFESSGNVRDTLRSVKYDRLKLFRVYDAQNRLTSQFECFAETRDGGECLRTDYIYDGGSNRIIKLRESRAQWSVAWDV